MEIVTGVLGLILGNVVCDIRHPELEMTKTCEPQVIEKNMYPKNLSYIVDLKKQPIQVMILKESDIQKLAKKVGKK